MDNQGNLDVIFQEGILENRPWDDITVYSAKVNSFTRQQLNDRFLLNVVRNCKSFRFISDNSFNVEGIIKLIEVCVRENLTKQSIELGLIRCDESLFENAEQRIADSINRLNLQFTFNKCRNYAGVRNMCQISNGAVEISFTLCVNN